MWKSVWLYDACPSLLEVVDTSRVTHRNDIPGWDDSIVISTQLSRLVSWVEIASLLGTTETRAKVSPEVGLQVLQLKICTETI